MTKRSQSASRSPIHTSNLANISPSSTTSENTVRDYKHSIKLLESQVSELQDKLDHTDSFDGLSSTHDSPSTHYIHTGSPVSTSSIRDPKYLNTSPMSAYNHQAYRSNFSLSSYRKYYEGQEENIRLSKKFPPGKR